MRNPWKYRGLGYILHEIQAGKSYEQIMAAAQEEKEKFMGGDNMGDLEHGDGPISVSLQEQIGVLQTSIINLLQRIEALESRKGDAPAVFDVSATEVGGDMGGKGRR